MWGLDALQQKDNEVQNNYELSPNDLTVAEKNILYHLFKIVPRQSFTFETYLYFFIDPASSHEAGHFISDQNIIYRALFIQNKCNPKCYTILLKQSHMPIDLTNFTPDKYTVHNWQSHTH